MKRFVQTAALAAMLLMPVAGLAAGYRYFVDLRVSGYTGLSALEGFPLLVKVLESSVPGFRYADVTGGDAAIRFFDASGELLPSECEYWNPSGESIFWVRLPVLSGTATTLRMKWPSSVSGALP